MTGLEIIPDHFGVQSLRKQVAQLEKTIDLHGDVIEELFKRLLKRVKRIEEVLLEDIAINDLTFTPYEEDPK